MGIINNCVFFFSFKTNMIYLSSSTILHIYHNFSIKIFFIVFVLYHQNCHSACTNEQGFWLICNVYTLKCIHVSSPIYKKNPLSNVRKLPKVDSTISLLSWLFKHRICNQCLSLKLIRIETYLWIKALNRHVSFIYPSNKKRTNDNLYGQKLRAQYGITTTMGKLNIQLFHFCLMFFAFIYTFIELGSNK